MAERRLDPDQLRARLQATLAASSPRGLALPNVTDPGNVGSASANPETENSGAQIEPRVTVRSSPPSSSSSHQKAHRRRDAPKPLPTSPTPKSEQEKPTSVLHRNDRGAVLRGYRVPVELHRKVERAKLRVSAERGVTVFWDEVIQDAIDAISSDVHLVAATLGDGPDRRSAPAPATRVLQATIRYDQEMRLRTLRLDLEEVLERTVRLEELWNWLIHQVVDKFALEPALV